MSLQPPLETLEIEPTEPANASVIWMHGLGADANDFYGIAPELQLPAGVEVRYVFPNAPRMPVTINGGMVMQAWYDVKGIGERDQDEDGIRASADRLYQLLDREVARGVPSNRIILAGFSQGGAMALFAGLRYPRRLAGVICLSGYLVLADTFCEEAAEANQSTPIFQAHGSSDPPVPLDLGLRSREALVGADYAVTWREYMMGHQVHLQEIRDLGVWMAHTLNDLPSDT